MAEAKSNEMSIIEHIAELRKTVLMAFGLAVVATVVAWFFSDGIVNRVLAPAVEAVGQPLYFTKPMEAFLLKLKVSAAVGLFLVLPLILMRVYAFVLPGLYEKERRIATPLLVMTTALFYVGVGFCFFVLMPMLLRFMRNFETESLSPWWTAGEYFSLVANLALAFGLLFELPIVVFVLSWAGVVSPRMLLRGWRVAMVVILVVSAILTPPDIISQALLGGPVMLLYVISCLVAMAVTRRRH